MRHYSFDMLRHLVFIVLFALCGVLVLGQDAEPPKPEAAPAKVASTGETDDLDTDATYWGGYGRGGWGGNGYYGNGWNRGWGWGGRNYYGGWGGRGYGGYGGWGWGGRGYGGWGGWGGWGGYRGQWG